MLVLGKNFNNLNYERISYEKTKKEVNDFVHELKKADNYESFLLFCKKIISIQNHIEEMYDYADIRNMRDSSDMFFSKELEYWNMYKPKFDLLFVPFYEIVIVSPYKTRLLEIVPSNFFTSVEFQLKISNDVIVGLQQKENELKNQYRLLKQKKIQFEGKNTTYSYIAGFFTNKNRRVRKNAQEAINDYYYANQEEYDKILYDLVLVRNEMAQKLGFANYVTYSLYRLKRFGYDYENIAQFRNNINLYVSPIVKKLKEWQKEELSLNQLEYYDTIFFSEMPKLKYSNVELLQEIEKSFSKVDGELASLFSIMLQSNYMDLEQRENKVTFAITNYLTETCMPVITGNFKNTYGDVKTITHEMGHAFQKYCASIKDQEYLVSPLLKYPTMEIAEMFSYAMELLSMKALENVFATKEDYQKYCFLKIHQFICDLPYICLVDEFQERIYEKTDLKREDLRKTWLELAKKYHLESENTGHINLETGGYFYRQSHIYLDPFYYIDYGLSYFGAFVIFDQCSNHLDFFKKVGSVASYYSFKELIKQYGMPNPFSEEVVKGIFERLEEELVLSRNYFKK